MTLPVSGAVGVRVWDPVSQQFVNAQGLGSGVALVYLVNPAAASGLSSAVGITGPFGQALQSFSFPVTIASDQSPIPTTGGGAAQVTPVQFGLSSVAPISGMVPVVISGQPPVTPVQFGLSSVAPVGGSVPVVMGTTAVSIAGTPTVLIGGQPVSVSGNAVQAVQFGLSSVTPYAGQVPVQIGGSVPVHIVQFGLSSVAAVGGQVPVVIGAPPVTMVQFGLSSVSAGQKTMSASMPVVFASDQSALPNAGRVQTTNPPGAADGATASLALDYLGKQVMTPFAARGLSAMGTCAISGVGEQVFIAAQGSTVYTDLISLIIANTSSTIPNTVLIRGALGSSCLGCYRVMPNDTLVVPFTSPLEAPARNMAWTAQLVSVMNNGSFLISGKAARLI